MKCPRCNSENIQMQTREGKGLSLVLFALIFGGIGLMILSIVGLVLGALLGCLVGAVVKAALPKHNETVAVCQACGYTSEPIPQGLPSQGGHPLFSTDADCNLSITRENSFTGSAIFLVIRVDNHKPFNLSNGMTVNLKLDEGIHKIAYEQGGGLGKNNRKGCVDLSMVEGAKHKMSLAFTKTGLDVTKTW